MSVVRDVSPRQANRSVKTMKKPNHIRLTACLVTLMAAGAFVSPLNAADEKDSPMAEFMKAYHKAPKGTDPVCKRAQNGQATKEELKKLVEGYKMMAESKAPKGDAASWKEKTTVLLAAAKSLQKGEPGAEAKYKEAVNCKACHSEHKPD